MNVRTTMIYTHVLNRGGHGARVSRQQGAQSPPGPSLYSCARHTASYADIVKSAEPRSHQKRHTASGERRVGGITPLVYCGSVRRR